MFNGLLGPRNFTVVNFKQRPTTLTLSHATLAHALNVMGYCYSFDNLTQLISFFFILQKNLAFCAGHLLQKRQVFAAIM